ncbi:putative membrane protein [Microdochium nivale]|nr:putative membrane protein [Microdochium nivale]
MATPTLASAEATTSLAEPGFWKPCTPSSDRVTSQTSTTQQTPVPRQSSASCSSSGGSGGSGSNGMLHHRSLATKPSTSEEHQKHHHADKHRKNGGGDDGIELQCLSSTLVSTTSSKVRHTIEPGEDNDSDSDSAERSRASRSAAASRHSTSEVHVSDDGETKPREDGAGAGGIRRLQRFWRDHVNMNVEHSTCRDHLALERTYLGYFRTSTLMATAGVLIAQLYILDESASGSGRKTGAGLHVARPLATACFGLALWIITWGTCRYLRFQSALVRGRALSGGFELTLVLGFSLALLVGIFVISIVSEI